MKKSLSLILSLVILILLSSGSFAEESKRTQAPKDAEVYIISPKNGDVVGKNFVVKFGLKNMGIAPAGSDIKNTGHHHLIVNGELPDFDYPIADENIIHFGGGQTETTLDLEQGTHSLQMILGDANHVPHDPPIISDKIRVIVQ